MMAGRDRTPRGLSLAFRLWDWLTEPAVSIQDFEERLKSRWMATILVVLVPSGLLVAMVPPLVDGRPPLEDPQVLGVFAFSIFLVVCYCLSRRGHYRTAALIAIVAGTLTIYSNSLLDNDPVGLLSDASYLTATLMLSSIMLTRRATVVILVINVIALLLQPLLSTQVSIENVLKGPLSLLLVTFGLVMFGAYLGNVLEKHHMGALQKENAERRRAEEHLSASNQEKEMLLKEIHHRVKNNLQIISSLLNLQAGSIGDPLTLSHFQESQNRIRTMALIHQHLYRSEDVAGIDFATYLQDLTSSLMESYRGQDRNVALRVEADPVRLVIDTAIPCGLIVNELVSNALKHAFPHERSGQVGVEFRKEDRAELYRLEVWDDGLGIPADVDLQNTPSLGLQLVNSLVRQLGGTTAFHPAPGTRVTVCFPDPKARSEA